MQDNPSPPGTDTEQPSGTETGAQEATPLQNAPTAFATGTGYLFQVVGTFLILTACVAWAISGLVSRSADQPVERWLDYLTGASAPSASLTVALLNSLVGGAGLLAAGVGLQNERPSSGRFALLVVGTMAAVYWFVFGNLIACEGGWLLLLVAALLALAASLLFLFAWRSAAILKRHPGPEHNIVTDEFLEELHRQRLERRRSKGY